MRRTHPSAVMVLCLAAIVLVGCGASGQSGSGLQSPTAPSSLSDRSSTRSTSATATRSAHRAGRADATAATPPSSGWLPQTDQLPSATTPQFRAQMRALWRAIVTNSVSAGTPAFFPEAAFLQVKTVADPRTDYVEFIAGWRLDIAALRQLLAPDPGSAQLVRVDVPRSFAHWVVPGTCLNRVGYWEVPNARVVYRQGGTVRSFGIASLISWRGAWYVIHLGSILRPGVVDAPATGPGVSAPSSTC